MTKKTRQQRRTFKALLAERSAQPFDPMVRVRLAGFLERHGHRLESLEEYRLAGRLFLREGLTRKAAAVFKTVLALAPADQSASAGLWEAERDQRVQTVTRREAADQNRRAAPRIPWPSDILVWGTVVRSPQFSGNRVFAVQGVDLSQSGILATTAFGIPLGTEVELTVYIPRFDWMGSGRGQVSRRTTEPEGGVGIQLHWLDRVTTGLIVAHIAGSLGASHETVRSLHEAALRASHGVAASLNVRPHERPSLPLVLGVELIS